ncbi:MAG TPA: inorganic phosphate transporter [Elusimicrobiota bacterium]|nr:inorganic phosphate transporter [Elusimicrobiota bacterium]
MNSFGAVCGIVALAFFFDFLNGMHDAANEIATVVSTRVLSPKQAVLWAACFHMAAAVGFGVHVANTVGKGLVDPSILDNTVILGALVGGAFWNWLTIRMGIPVSSTHSLIGGLVGAAVAKAGFGCLLFRGLSITVAFMIISPIVGLFLGFGLMIAVYWGFRKYTGRQVDTLFRTGQLLSSGFLSLAHGLNDAQKTMGLIAVLLFTNHLIGPTFHIPYWVILSCYAVISLGTLAGGWRVVHTVVQKITKLKPVSGFCVEFGSGACIFLCSLVGIPVSTTHVVSGSLLGVGSTQRLSAVRWGVAGRIVWAWILTIPCAAAVSALTYFALHWLVLI